MKETIKRQLEQLKQDIEATIGHEIQTPKDYDLLSEAIFQQTKENIGRSTLMRLWGYVKYNGQPSQSTLDVLAHFLGYADWEAYTHTVTPAQQSQNQESASHWKRRIMWIIPVMLLVIGVGYWVYQHANTRQNDSSYILHQGQQFANCDDYLRLFGLIDVKELPFYQVHPHYPHIILWGPEFHHPDWLNDGNPDSLMPTITERWQPDTIPELVELYNADLYYNGRRHNDIRLTFMKSLTDTTYTFLGAYRFSLTLSDTTHIVWERVAEDVDLAHLDYLEQLRN